jgi:hypothetical protein
MIPEMLFLVLGLVSCIHDKHLEVKNTGTGISLNVLNVGRFYDEIPTSTLCCT